jgi:gliding motility-associated-like protein
VGTCLLLHPETETTALRSTKEYALSDIQYDPYPFSGGTQVLNRQDDVWSEAITLPFEFCFFGQKYHQCVIGANGNITFDLSQARASQSFRIYTAPYFGACYNNCIMGAYYDVDPSKGGEIRYATYGTAPCRTFVVSWTDIPLYDCNWLKGTQQIVLHESTYAIEVFIHKKPICASWESGNGVLGIQNADASNDYIFPGKNCSAWSDTDGGYRFTPSAQPDRYYKWYNMRSGMVISTTDTVSVSPTDTTTYLLQTTFASQCDLLMVSDTVRINVQHIYSEADFDFTIRYGCTGDTVIFSNHSSFGSLPAYKQQFLWDFGDGSTDTARNPVHIYTRQGSYIVKLTTKGPGVCEQTAQRQIGILKTLHAGFSLDRDSFCQHGAVSFTDTSAATLLYGIWPKLKWVFGDGQKDSTTQNPVHYFNQPGVYEVLQIISNGIPCHDTARHLIVIDSIPYVGLRLEDTALCAGAPFTMRGDYMRNGYRGLRWQFGDGSGRNDSPSVQHSYEHPGTYTVQFTARYRLCPDTSAWASLLVKPHPVVNLGPDTSICPGAAILDIRDQLPRDGNGIARHWSTGDTGVSIAVRHPDVFSLEVTMDGCSGSDTIVVAKGCFINIPNAFTPNGDGENDYFIPLELLSRGIATYQMHIFNRWGQLVYDSRNNASRGWDGSYNGLAQPMGVYVYTLSLEFINGVKEYYQGNMTLIR